MVFRVKNIDAYRLRLVVFDILHSLKSLEDVTISSLRRSCEIYLDLKEDSLKGPVVKELLAKILSEFNSVFMGFKKDTLNPGYDYDDEVPSSFNKSRKFSEAETAFIMKVVGEYTAANPFVPLCRGTRAIGNRHYCTTGLWKELCILIPNRYKKSMQELVEIELMKGEYLVLASADAGADAGAIT